MKRAVFAAAQKGRTEAVDALVMGAASAGVPLQQLATDATAVAIDLALRNTAKMETSVQSEALAPSQTGRQSPAAKPEGNRQRRRQPTAIETES